MFVSARSRPDPARSSAPRAGTLNVSAATRQPMLSAWLAQPARRRHPVLRRQRGRSAVPGPVRRGAARSRSSNSPATTLVVVWRDADLEWRPRRSPSASTAPARSAWCPSTRSCIRPIADELPRAAGREVAEIRPGYPEDGDVLLTPVLRNDSSSTSSPTPRQGRRGAVRRTAHGASTGRRRRVVPGADRRPGRRAGRRRSWTRSRQETFFPLLPVVVPEPATTGRCWTSSSTS